MIKLPAFEGVRILVVGDVMLDRYWFGEVHRISPEAPVPVLKVSRVDERPGGAANVARNIAVLGAKVTLLSVVGDDEAGVCLEKLLKEYANLIPLLHRDSSISTIVKLRAIARQQQLLRRGSCARTSGRHGWLEDQRWRAGLQPLPAVDLAIGISAPILLHAGGKDQQPPNSLYFF